LFNLLQKANISVANQVGRPTTNEFIKVEGQIVRVQVEEFCGVKKTKATTLLKGLCDKGIIVKIGVGKNTKYRVIEQ
jgi:hypothetical protein